MILKPRKIDGTAFSKTPFSRRWQPKLGKPEFLFELVRELSDTLVR
jgi:hypothetical protein